MSKRRSRAPYRRGFGRAEHWLLNNLLREKSLLRVVHTPAICSVLLVRRICCAFEVLLLANDSFINSLAPAAGPCAGRGDVHLVIRARVPHVATLRERRMG